MYGDEKVVVEQRDGVVYAAPGSVTGAAKAEGCVRERAVSCRVEGPSFVLLSLIPSAINVFTYTLKDGKLDVKKDTFPKNAYMGLLQTRHRHRNSFTWIRNVQSGGIDAIFIPFFPYPHSGRITATRSPPSRIATPHTAPPHTL